VLKKFNKFLEGKIGMDGKSTEAPKDQPMKEAPTEQ